MLATDIWGSITKMTQSVIAEVALLHPEVEFGFIDWEAHANIMELPEMDLIGPTAINITEHSQQFVEVNFALAVSTYASDENLFRQREIVSVIFERMRAQKQIPFFDAASASPKGYMIFTDGTAILPMSRADARPFQFVQGSCLLEPSSLGSA